MSFYDVINNSTPEVEEMLKRNDLNISKKEIKKFFNSLSKTEKDDILSENSYEGQRAFYQIIVTRYIFEVLKINSDDFKLSDNIYNELTIE